MATEELEHALAPGSIAELAEALEIRRTIRDAREIATTLCSLGMLEIAVGDADGGARLLDEARAIYEHNDDGPGMQGISQNLGTLALDSGDAERACALLEQAVASARAQRLVRHVAWAAAALGEAALDRHDGVRARDALTEARASFVGCGERRGLRHVEGLQQRLGPMLSGC